MKAAIVAEPGRLVLRDVSMPRIGDYGVLCEILYGATCTGTDGHLIAGRMPFPVNYPTVLGHESIGRVVEVGAKVRNFKPGDHVTRVGMLANPAEGYEVNWGGFAEFGVAQDHWAMCQDGRPQGEWDGFRVNQIVPAGITPGEATMIITWRETLSYTQRMGVGEGHNVLVLGSGGNGLAFAAHAANRGANQVVIIGSEEREQAANEVGVTAYYGYKDEGLMKSIQAGHAEGFDFIIDSLGKKDGLDTVLPLLRSGGTVGIYGLDEVAQCVVHPSRASGGFRYYNGGYDEEETHETVVNLMRKGMLQAAPWLDLENYFSLEDIQCAYDAVAERKMVKALIKIADE